MSLGFIVVTEFIYTSYKHLWQLGFRHLLLFLFLSVFALRLFVSPKISISFCIWSVFMA